MREPQQDVELLTLFAVADIPFGASLGMIFLKPSKGFEEPNTRGKSRSSEGKTFVKRAVDTTSWKFGIFSLSKKTVVFTAMSCLLTGFKLQRTI
jgi:hypothetical protein